MIDEPNNPIDEAGQPFEVDAVAPQGEPIEATPPSRADVEQAAAEMPAEGSPQSTSGGSSDLPSAEAADEEEPAVVAMSGGKPAKKTKAAKGPKVARAKAKAAPLPVSAEPKSENMNWYILKVQSNREESIREGLLRRMAIAGLDHYLGEVIVPTEKVTEVKQGKKRVTKRKLYPGYLVVQMEINDDTWFTVRETPGIGDFTGAAGTPTPMLPHEVNRILQRSEEKTDQAPKLDIRFRPGDRVKINEGTFENFEGEVDNIDQTNGRVTVMINIFGRSTPVELEYWQIESL